MNTMTIAAALLAGLSMPASASFRPIARDLGRAAASGKIARVAVLPFLPADGGRAADGWTISEKLLTQLVRSGRVQAVERSMLKPLFEEHKLGQTGALDPQTIKKLGRLLAADGIVMGSFVCLGTEIVVNARLVDAETGVILAASERRIERDWWLPGLGAPAARWQVEVPAPVFSVAPPVIEDAVEVELRDAPASDPCDAAPLRVDRLERQILDIKARYWALRLRKGLDRRTLTSNPGSTISDPELKHEFYERMKAWHQTRDIPELSPSEVKRFVAVDGKAYELARLCGI